jgi:hypothetical protein
MKESEHPPDSEDHKIPLFLKIAYIIILTWGIWALITYWNGSHGWFDRGHWESLQNGAKTKKL